MLVSHKHKFIFVKTIKTAGTSTEILLEPYCNSEIEESHGRQMTITEEGIIGTRMKQRFAEKSEYFNHMTPLEIADKIGHDKFNEYTKISNIRNPFDILVSHYHFKGTFIMFSKRKRTFEQYLIETDVVEQLANKYKELMFIDDKYVIDEIIRFENIEEDLDTLIKKLNLPEPIRQLQTYKMSSERKGIHYREFYNKELENKVAEHFKFYLDMYNYQF